MKKIGSPKKGSNAEEPMAPDGKQPSSAKGDRPSEAMPPQISGSENPEPEEVHSASQPNKLPLAGKQQRHIAKAKFDEQQNAQMEKWVHDYDGIGGLGINGFVTHAYKKAKDEDKGASEQACKKRLQASIGPNRKPFTNKTAHVFACGLDWEFEDFMKWLKPKKDGQSAESAERHRNDLIRFFGPAFDKEDAKYRVELLLSKRVLTQPAEEFSEPLFVKPKNCNFYVWCPDGTKEEYAGNVFTEGVSGYVSFETLVGATHVSSFVQREANREVWVRQESAAVSDAEKDCVIAFGLGFSAVTREVETWFKSNLFRVECGQSYNKKFGKTTDNLALWNDREKKVVSVPNPNGRNPYETDVALIARIVTGGPCPWFLVAGRCTAGTTAAAHFLVHHWEDLLAKYDEQENAGISIDRHSLAAVIRHRVPVDDADLDKRADSGQSFQRTAQLHHWDWPDRAHPCIAFSDQNLRADGK